MTSHASSSSRGSIKSNIGHLEGGSGLASIVKTVLILEKGVIPPNALLDEVNPDIDTGSGRIVVSFPRNLIIRRQEPNGKKFPKESVRWPGEGIHRASINSFGIGGTNSHLVLDDACKYLHMRRLRGHHVCRPDIRNSVHGAEYKPQDGLYPIKLLVWSAADEGAVRRMMKDFEVYYGSSVIHNPSKLNQLAYTLAERCS
ncbi:thiolase-like protein [Xylaria grammica]|nr:thiolase-like protein [Xylaria grammica]